MCYIRAEVNFEGPGVATESAFETFLDNVMEEFSNIERDDVDLTAALALRKAVFLGREPDASADSMVKFVSDLRTALLAANCATPKWPTREQITDISTISKEAVPA